MSKFMEIRPVGTEMFPAEGRTDGQIYMTKLRIAFRNFATAPKNPLLLKSFLCVFVFFGATAPTPQWAKASSFTRFSRSRTQRRTTVGRTPPDEWSSRRRDLYLTTCNTHNRQTSMPPVGFEATISAGERPQTYALDHAATGTGIYAC